MQEGTDQSGRENRLERRSFAGTDDVLTDRILKVFHQVYNELGFGFLESVYSRSMALALAADHMDAAPELAIPVFFRGHPVGIFRADPVVEGRIILEFKTAEQIVKAHEAQMLHYLRASDMEVGLILNFGPAPRVRRLEFKNDRKKRTAEEKA